MQATSKCSLKNQIKEFNHVNFSCQKKHILSQICKRNTKSALHLKTNKVTTPTNASRFNKTIELFMECTNKLTPHYLNIDFWMSRTLHPAFFTFLQISRIYCLSSRRTLSICVQSLTITLFSIQTQRYAKVHVGIQKKP